LPRRFIPDGIPPVRAAPPISWPDINGWTFEKTFALPGGVAWTAIDVDKNGVNLVLSRNTSGGISYSTFGTPWEVDTINTIQTNPNAGGTNTSRVRYSQNGDKLFTGRRISSVSYLVSSFNIAGWDVSAITNPVDASIDIGADLSTSGAEGFYFSPDGTRFYAASEDDVLTYSMSPGDVTSLSFVRKNIVNLNHNAEGHYISPDGVKYYHNRGTIINQYDMATPWDTSTFGGIVASLLLDKGTGGANKTFQVYINPAGNRLLLVLWPDRLIQQYNAPGT